MNLQLARTVSV